MRIVVDFDGTLCEHAYPEIGAEAPGAIDALLWLKSRGCWLGLFTMRGGDDLQAAIDWIEARGVTFDAYNEDDGNNWSDSPKMHGDVYIDDRALGCPTIEDGNDPDKRIVDWAAVRKLLEPLLDEYQEA